VGKVCTNISDFSREQGGFRGKRDGFPMSGL
jgi:hypothetical protein